MFDLFWLIISSQEWFFSESHTQFRFRIPKSLFTTMEILISFVSVIAFTFAIIGVQ